MERRGEQHRQPAFERQQLLIGDEAATADFVEAGAASALLRSIQRASPQVTMPAPRSLPAICRSGACRIRAGFWSTCSQSVPQA